MLNIYSSILTKSSDYLTKICKDLILNRNFHGYTIDKFLIVPLLMYSLNECFSLFNITRSQLFISVPNKVSVLYPVFSKRTVINSTYTTNETSSISEINKELSKNYKAILYYITTNKSNMKGCLKFTEVRDASGMFLNSIETGESFCISKRLGIYCSIEGNNSDIRLYKYFSIFTTSDSNRSNAINEIYKFVEQCESEYDLFLNQYKHLLLDYSVNNNHTFKNFNSPKTKDNLYIEDKEKIFEYVNQFGVNADNTLAKQKYAKSGYTFKSVILMEGLPGTGKTSTIKSILNETGRHGILVNFGDLKTKKQFLNVFKESFMGVLNIKHGKVCYIFENIDSYSNASVLFKDEFVEKVESTIDSLTDKERAVTEVMSNLTKTMSSLGKGKESIVDENANDDLDRATILNFLDGVHELEDIMIIFETNHVEKLHEAFLRPGRIDFTISFKHPSTDLIKKMLLNVYSLESLGKILDNKCNDHFIENTILLSKVQEICFTNTNVSNAIDLIIEEMDFVKKSEK